MHRSFVVIIFFILLFFLSTSQGHHVALGFAKPFSGEKVSTYEVELQMDKKKKRTFNIPDDCHSMMNIESSGGYSWGNQRNRNLWFKVINDCRYVTYLHRNEQIAEKDFLKDYDFYNAKLSDLPFSAHCGSGKNPMVNFMNCMPLPTGILSLSRFFPFLDIHSELKSTEIIPCALEDGIFRGRIIQSSQGIICQKDRNAPGLRLISVDYGDLNNDGVQDVLLRMLPLGRGLSKLPILLPLTRFSEESPFTLPEGLFSHFRLNE